MARRAKRATTKRKSTGTRKPKTARTSPIPPGWRTVTPYLVIDGAARAIEFYKKAFGAKEINRAAGPDGSIMNATIRIGDSFIMMCDEFPGGDTKAPTSAAGKTTFLGIASTLLVPTSGGVDVFGFDVVEEPEKVRPLIAVVPQEGKPFFHLTPREQVYCYLRSCGNSRGKDRRSSSRPTIWTRRRPSPSGCTSSRRAASCSKGRRRRRNGGSAGPCGSPSRTEAVIGTCSNRSAGRSRRVASSM